MVARPSSCPRRGVYVRLVARRFRLSEATAGRRRRHRRDAMVSDALEVFRGARPSAAPTRPRGPVGRSAAEDGAGTGTAVCVPRPGTPVDAAVDLDVVWSPGVLPAGP